MARRGEQFPVDLAAEPDARGDALGGTSVTIAVAALFLLVTNAVSLDGWAAELQPTPLIARLNDATAAWLGVTERAGLAAPRAALHAAWKKAQAARLAGQMPAAE